MEKNVDETKKMEKNLKSSSGFISGKMTQYLGLRYGPDVRFHYDILTDQTKEIKASLEESKDQVIEYELRILKEKGHVKT
jgi:ribosome-binding factor A